DWSSDVCSSDLYARLIQAAQQSAFSQHIGGSARDLPAEEFGSCHCACIDMVFLNMDAELSKFSHDLRPASLAVVRHEHEGNVFLQESGNKPVGAGDHDVARIDYSVHVDEYTVFHGSDLA